MERQKYVTHKSGLPLRLPPYLRRELNNGQAQMAELQVELITKNSLIGERDQNDVMPFNIESNLRLRRVAHHVSRDLVDLAKCLDASRFCTIVHGSVARGLARHPDSNDPSDVDIDLIVDAEIPLKVPDISRTLIYKMESLYGARVDCYVWSRRRVLSNFAEYGRLYLASCAYPIANEGGLWEEVRSLSLEAQRYIKLSSSAKKKLEQVFNQPGVSDMSQLRETLGITLGGREGLAFLSFDGNGQAMDPYTGFNAFKPLFAVVKDRVHSS